MSEPVNWIDRLDAMASWPKRHPFLAKVLGGLIFAAVAVAALVWRVKTMGHE